MSVTTLLAVLVQLDRLNSTIHFEVIKIFHLDKISMLNNVIK